MKNIESDFKQFIETKFASFNSLNKEDLEILKRVYKRQQAILKGDLNTILALIGNYSYFVTFFGQSKAFKINIRNVALLNNDIEYLNKLRLPPFDNQINSIFKIYKIKNITEAWKIAPFTKTELLHFSAYFI